jgi:hypothetical protein
VSVEHKKTQINLLANKTAEFRFYERNGRRVLCFCGKRFTCFLTHAPAPFFQDWCEKERVDLDEYAAHLRREGGSLAAHLQRVRDRALLEKVAGSAEIEYYSDIDF